MILDIQIKNNKEVIEFKINSRVHDVKYLYLDSYDNRAKYNSRDPKDHDHKLVQTELENTQFGHDKVYTIKANQIGEKRITRLWILTIVYDDGFIESRIVYDLSELYCLRMDLITMCDPCGDLANHKMLVTLMFREMLLRNAIQANHLEDALQYYSDIFRAYKGTSKNSCSSGTCNINR